MKILLTSVGCMGYVGLIKAFQEHKVKVFGVDNSENAVGFSFCDGFSVIPHGDDENYIPEILKVCQENKIRAIIPSSDHRTSFSGGLSDNMNSLAASAP